MTRVTRTLAIHLAESMLEKEKLEMERFEKNLKIKLQTEVTKRIPASVLSFFLRNPKYVTKNKAVQLLGNGWAGQILYLYEELPAKKGMRITFRPTPIVAKELLEMHKELNSSQKRLGEEKRKIINKIVSFKTIENLINGYKEVERFLPKSLKSKP